jgi:hypothetical protein
MKLLRTAVFAILVAGLVAASSAAAASLIGIYRNPMASKGQLRQIVKLSGERCGRGGTGNALKIVVGKATRECSYRTPVVGRDLEIAATLRLLGMTPKPVQRSAFLALDLRSGGDARYQLAVYPLQRKAQLRKILADGSVRYLDIEKGLGRTVGGAERPNQLRLRAFNVTSGEEKGVCRIRGFVGRQLVVDAVDRGAGELSGRFSAFSVGSPRVAKGAQATVDDVVIRVPGPF